MIPKIIHYCWFGKNDKPSLFYKCYRSWEKYCKDFKFIEWNEENFDINSAPRYVQQAYYAKKWSFVTDYVRLQVVYEHGGVYLDTDVELKKKLDNLLKYNAFFGFEDGTHIATGLGFGAVAGHSLLKALMDDYEESPFILSDGSLDLTPCPERNTRIFLQKGLIQNDSMQILKKDVLILPTIYFCPIDYKTGKYSRSLKTISVHWFSESWKTVEQKKERKDRIKLIKKRNSIHYLTHIPNRILKKFLGEEKYNFLKKLKGK